MVTICDFSASFFIGCLFSSYRCDFSFPLFSLHLPTIQGVVTAAVSLIACLCKKNPDDFKTCVSLAVSRLSRVSEERKAKNPFLCLVLLHCHVLFQHFLNICGRANWTFLFFFLENVSLIIQETSSVLTQWWRMDRFIFCAVIWLLAL